MIYADRNEAGRKLAAALEAYAGKPDVIVFGLPRGGVPVAAQVADELNAPLDVFIVRKLGAPGNEEYAMGAIASGGVRVLNEDAIRTLAIAGDAIERATKRELAEIARREQLYRGGRPPLNIKGKTVVIVDDGLATGSTMEAAIKAVRKQSPARIVVAVPVGAPETCARLAGIADELICLAKPELFQAVGMWYRDFAQTTDDEVRSILAERSAAVPAAVY